MYVKDPSDYDSFFEDTLKAGHYENDQKSVEIMIKSSPDVVKDLVKYGVSFTRDENGVFLQIAPSITLNFTTDKTPVNFLC